MSRPQRTSLIRQRIGKTNYEMEIALGDGHWIVLYDNQPINIVKHNYYNDIKKYSRNGFPFEGHAHNLCKKLNAQFNTALFTVRKVA